jgi:succinyl-CoA synthetase beta subunit
VLAQARAAGHTQLDEYAATQLVTAYGIPCSLSRPVETPQDAVLAAAEIARPIALKILSERIGHKSDVGGIRLGLEDPEAIRAATDELLTLAHGLGVPDARVLVQEMRHGDVELIVGLKHDPAFGPVVVVGIGGVLVNVLADTQTAVAPVDHATARRLLTSLRGSALFGVVRGRPVCDLDAVADVIVRLSWLAVDHATEITELDVNPLLIDAHQGTVTVVDSLAILENGPPSTGVTTEVEASGIQPQQPPRLPSPATGPEPASRKP